MNKILCILLVLGFITLSCKKEKKIIQTVTPPINVDIAIVNYDTLNKFIEVNGVVYAKDFLDIQPEVNGRIVYLNIPEGKYVSKGTLLARLNDEDLRAQLGQLEVQLDLAKINADRLKKLLDIKATTQSDYDIASTQIKSVEAQIAYTNSLIKKTYIYAPFDGIIGTKKISLGAYVSPQTVIANFEGVDGYKLDIELPAIYLNQVKKGDSVYIKTEESDKEITAAISIIESEINPNSQNVKVSCRLPSRHKMGAYAKVRIEVEKNKAGFYVPSNLIFPEGSHKKLMLIKNGLPTFVEVLTGYRTNTLVEIVKGLSLNDSLVIKGSLFLRPNSKYFIDKTISLKSIINNSK